MNAEEFKNTTEGQKIVESVHKLIVADAAYLLAVALHNHEKDEKLVRRLIRNLENAKNKKYTDSQEWRIYVELCFVLGVPSIELP